MLKKILWKIRYAYCARKRGTRKLTARNISQNALDRIMEDIIHKMNFQKDDIVLDIGCANGELLRRISKNIKFGVGIDMVPSMVKAAKKNNKGKKNLRFRTGDMRKLPDLETRFSKVMCYSALHYLSSKKEAFMVIKGIQKLCKPGAMVLLGDLPNKEVSKAENLIDKIADKLHLKFYKKEVISMAIKLGGKATILDQPSHLPYSDQMFDVLIQF